MATRADQQPRLQGRVAVVTGGGRGLGLAITRLLAARGALVVIGSRNAGALAEAAAGLVDDGLNVHAVPCDVTRRDEVLALRDAALNFGGRVDIWVNNAGRAGVFGPVRRVPEDDFLATTDAIVRGTYHGSLAALDVMQRQGDGDLINLLGRGDDGPVANQAGYGSAKAWVRAFTGALAAEHRGSGVRVHAFNPGLVRTDLLGRVDAVRGYGGGLQRLVPVVGALGADPDEAALPLLKLIGSDRVEYRAAAPLPLLQRAGGNLLNRLRHREAPPLTITVTEVPDRATTLTD